MVEQHADNLADKEKEDGRYKKINLLSLHHRAAFFFTNPKQRTIIYLQAANPRHRPGRIL